MTFYKEVYPIVIASIAIRLANDRAKLRLETEYISRRQLSANKFYKFESVHCNNKAADEDCGKIEQIKFIIIFCKAKTNLFIYMFLMPLPTGVDKIQLLSIRILCLF